MAIGNEPLWPVVVLEAVHLERDVLGYPSEVQTKHGSSLEDLPDLGHRGRQPPVK